MFRNDFYHQPTKEYISNRAKVQLVKLFQKDRNIKPIIIKQNKIAWTWWGVSWNKNLERYADYINRLPRGKTYVQSGSVIDLRIDKNIIRAVVVGSKNYDIKIEIEPIQSSKIKDIYETINGQIATIESMLKGDFPSKFKDLFFNKDNGLFPKPSEIHMHCNCPDGAHMCKHIAAVLYGVGNKLDQNPLLFFQLRGIDINTLIKKTIKVKIKNLLKSNNKTKSKRLIDDDSLQKIFHLNED